MNPRAGEGQQANVRREAADGEQGRNGCAVGVYVSLERAAEILRVDEARVETLV